MTTNKWLMLMFCFIFFVSACGTSESVTGGSVDEEGLVDEVTAAELLNDLKDELKEELRKEIKEELENELREQLLEKELKTEATEEKELHTEIYKEELSWGGQWEINDHPDVSGYLHIYDETDDGFYFDIHVAYTHVGEIEGAFAIKNGNVAKSVEDEYGCVMTLTRNGNFISTEEGPECYVWSGMAIDLNREFTR
ncbi:MAG: hypothetical protein LPK26_19355 [Bacillaceae bacterium]|nr:hypothetical protein [Bacillaceae bacterium]